MSTDTQPKTEEKKLRRRRHDSSVKASDERLPGIVERLKGGSSLIAESKALGVSHNGPLRQALRELIGVEQYAALMTENTARRHEKESKPKTGRSKKKECSPVQASASEGSESQ